MEILVLFRGCRRIALFNSLAWFRRAFQLALGLNNLLLKRHLNLGTFFFHGAECFSFSGGYINHVAFLLLVAERFLNFVSNFDGVAFGLLVTVGFSFKIFDLYDDTFGFTLINIDGLGGWNLNLDTLLNFLTVRFFDNVRNINKSAFGNLDINTNCLGAGNLGGDLFGNILANNFGNLCTEGPLAPAIQLFRRARMAFINHDGIANLFNLGFYLVFHDGGFVTFLFSDGGTFFFLPYFGYILKVLFALCGTF